MPIAMPDEDLKAGILALLPEDGTPVLNRIMRVMLARRHERSVDDEAFSPLAISFSMPARLDGFVDKAARSF